MRYNEKLLRKKHTCVIDITGRSMKGWWMIASDGHRTAKQLRAGVKEGVEFTLALPPK